MKFVTALLIITFSISSWSYIIINPSQIIYDFAPASKDQPETLNINAFCPKSWDRYGAKSYQHCKTFELNTTLANLKNYVLQVNQQGLSQEEALDLWYSGENLQKKSENSLAFMFVGALAGPAIPAIAFFKGLFNSMSSDSRRDKVIQMTHPFTLLAISHTVEKKRMWIDDDSDFEKYLAESINSYNLRSTTEPLFNQRVLDLKNKEIEKQKHIDEIRKARETVGEG